MVEGGREMDTIFMNYIRQSMRTFEHCLKSLKEYFNCSYRKCHSSFEIFEIGLSILASVLPHPRKCKQLKLLISIEVHGYLEFRTSHKIRGRTDISAGRLLILPQTPPDPDGRLRLRPELGLRRMFSCSFR